MAMSSVSEGSRGFAWNNPCRQPLRPITTSPSFYPYQTLKSLQKEASVGSNRNQLETHFPRREYFSLPSTPPRRDEVPGHSFIKAGTKSWESDRKLPMEPWVGTPQDENGNKFLPEWYIEPCIEVLKLPDEKETERSDLIPVPLDHTQKKEMFCHDSSYDEDYEFSDESPLVDLEDCPAANPNSDEVAKLNPLGQGQSRFMSLFHCQEEGSSCCSSASLSDKFEEVLDASTESTPEIWAADEIVPECDIDDGIEAVRQGLARLLSIPAETSSHMPMPQINEPGVMVVPSRKSSDNDSGSGESRLLKLFPSSSKQQDDEKDQQQDSPLCISSLWKSDSSLANGANYFSSECSSLKDSPNIFIDEGSPSPSNLRVPNIVSISPTAPLLLTPMATSHFIEGFPSQSEPTTSGDANVKFFTACDLSNEETEIEAALERGDGFFTNDDHHFLETQPIDDSIWSPAVVHGSFKEEVEKLDSINSMSLKEIAENAAHNIMDWLDDWLSHCTDARSQDGLLDDLDTLRGAKTDEDQVAAQEEEKELQATALDLYKMFEGEVDDSAFQKFLNMAEDDFLSEAGCAEENIFAQFAQSPGILDFLVENDTKEKKEKAEHDHLQAQLSGPSFHFLLNSRASDIYNSYLLFPDLMQFAAPKKSHNAAECKNLEESSIFSHIFSKSFDWMGNIDMLDKNPSHSWDQTLQSLSPKTPFTPTGNISEHSYSCEKRHSITLEQLCNLASVASSIESTGIDGSSFSSTDFLVQYLQSQLGCFENIALFNSPTTKNDCIPENDGNYNWNKECARLYRPIPIFPLQFINRLSLTNFSTVDDKDEQEDLLFSPETHFRPITPGADVDSSQESSSSGESRRAHVESVSEDVDEELVAIHEGADHAKLVGLYAQMQLKQQLAAEQKQNYPQLVTVEEDGYTDGENAYEDKHMSRLQSEDDMNDYALDRAEETAATVAVNALGSADPAEALAILEEWHWKENVKESGSVANTFPDLGYFETAQSFLPSSESLTVNEASCFLKQPSVLDEESESNSLAAWSTEDDCSPDQNFEYDSDKKIWIRTRVCQQKDSSEVDSCLLDLSFPEYNSLNSDGLDHVERNVDCGSSWQIILSQQIGTNDSTFKSHTSLPEDHPDIIDDGGYFEPINHEQDLVFGLLNVGGNDHGAVKPG